MLGSKQIIVDAGPLIALVRKQDSNHHSCLNTLKELPPATQLVTTVSALAETFAVLPPSVRTIESVQNVLLGLPVRLEYIQNHELMRAFELMIKYVDLPMDFADAEVLVIAERLQIKSIFTLDRRDFSIYRPKHMRRMQIIP